MPLSYSLTDLLQEITNKNQGTATMGCPLILFKIVLIPDLAG